MNKLKNININSQFFITLFNVSFIIILGILFLVVSITKDSCFFIVFCIMFFYYFYHNSQLHNITIEMTTLSKKFLVVMVTILTILVCIIPMGKSPIWNGEIPEHRNQYELITESILKGSIEFNYGNEKELLLLKILMIQLKEGNLEYFFIGIIHTIKVITICILALSQFF